MTLDEFVTAFGKEFDETPLETFKSDTVFSELPEWGSLVALSIISMIDENMDKSVTGADIRNAKTIEDLYNIACTK